jgi:O-methyltransferase
MKRFLFGIWPRRKDTRSGQTLKLPAVEATEADYLIFGRVRPFTMTSQERQWALLSAIRYLVENNIPGDIVECGVWRGGSTMLAALKLIELGSTDRYLWLYDTFDGMTEPSEKDYEAESAKFAKDLLITQEQIEGNNLWCIASIEDVRRNLQSTGYPIEKYRICQGDVKVTLLSEVPEQIALLRLDTDWYESTKVEMEVLFPRLVAGGICIIDDYGHWAGARQAVDEYLAAHGFYPLLHRIDYTGRLFFKP